MEDIFVIKRSDGSPAIRYALIPSDITLAGATVRFKMRRMGGPTVIDAPAEIIDTSPPVVGYEWQPGDTLEAGRYEAEFRVEYADGKPETFPNRGFIAVLVFPNVPDL